MYVKIIQSYLVVFGKKEGIFSYLFLFSILDIDLMHGAALAGSQPHGKKLSRKTRRDTESLP